MGGHATVPPWTPPPPSAELPSFPRSHFSHSPRAGRPWPEGLLLWGAQSRLRGFLPKWPAECFSPPESSGPILGLQSPGDGWNHRSLEFDSLQEMASLFGGQLHRSPSPDATLKKPPGFPHQPEPACRAAPPPPRRSLCPSPVPASRSAPGQSSGSSGYCRTATGWGIQLHLRGQKRR